MALNALERFGYALQGFDVDEMMDKERQRSELAALAASMGGQGAVPSQPGVMGPQIPQAPMQPMEALARMAEITGDPTQLINYQVQQSDPMRELERRKYEAQIEAAEAQAEQRRRDEQKVPALANMLRDRAGGQGAVPETGMGPQIPQAGNPRLSFLADALEASGSLDAASSLAGLAFPDIDLKNLATQYAITKASGGEPTPEMEMGANAWEMLNRGEIEYDPDTGQPRPTYRSLTGLANAPQQPAPQQPDPPPAQQPTAPMEGAAPQPNAAPQGEFTIPEPPQGLYPKAQLEFQKEAIKDQFQRRVDTEDKRQSQQDFERTLMSMADEYKKLQDEGALPQVSEVPRDYLENPMRFIAGTETLDPFGITPGGQSFGRMFGTKAQSIRDKINTKRPQLFLKIRESGGLTGKELDTAKERDFYLKTLGQVNLPYPVIQEAIAALSEQYGTGEAASSIYSATQETSGKSNRLRYNPATDTLEPVQ